MATRKTTTKIDPIVITAAALRAIKTSFDYHRIGSSNPTETVTAAWEHLTELEQQRITEIVNNDTQPEPQSIADELMACGSLIQLQAIKSNYGDVAVKAAWRLLPQPERDRLTNICKNVPQPPEETAAVTETPTTYKVEPQVKRTLFSIGDDLETLNDLLDGAGDDTEQINLINDWFSTLGEERDRKLDNYASLISEMQGRAAIRKVEAQRLIELSTSDELRAKQMKDRLKIFFEQHDIRKIDTQRYRLSLCNNSSRPLVVDPNIATTDLPEKYQKVSIEANTTTIREDLKAGVELPFARLGDAGKHIRIK